MKKNLLLLTALLVASLGNNLSAQVRSEGGYDFHYDYDHMVVVRSIVSCDEEYQDLWNGDIVRLSGETVYIYHDDYRILYGDRIWLTHTGDYIVRNGDTEYLYDCEGYRVTGVYGDWITMLWNGVVLVYRSGYYYLYTTSGYRLGSIYSTERIQLYWNGYYCYCHGDSYYVADPDGDRVGGIYSDDPPSLTTNGYFRVTHGSYTYLYDTDGYRI